MKMSSLGTSVMGLALLRCIMCESINTHVKGRCQSGREEVFAIVDKPEISGTAYNLSR